MDADTPSAPPDEQKGPINSLGEGAELSQGRLRLPLASRWVIQGRTCFFRVAMCVFFERGEPFFVRGVPFFMRGLIFFERGLIFFERGLIFFEREVPFFERGELFFDVLIFAWGLTRALMRWPIWQA